MQLIKLHACRDGETSVKKPILAEEDSTWYALFMVKYLFGLVHIIQECIDAQNK